MKNRTLSRGALFLAALPFVFLFSASRLFAQRVITISYAQDMKGNYNFSCTNRAYCNYILDLDFTTLDNARSDHPMPYRAVVKPGVNKLFKLSPLTAGNPVQFKYKTGFFKGCPDAKVDTAFMYLLPIGPGRSAQAYELGDMPKMDPGDPAARNVYAIRLRMRPGDTIYAARRGVVTEADVSSNLNDSGVAGGSWNYIEIVHADCSFARYGILKRDGALVKPGQSVEAGVPIGLVGGDRFGRGSDIRFAVYYDQVTDQNTGNGNAPGLPEVYWTYIPIKFWTKKNGKGMLRHGATYTSEFPKAILAQETPHHPHAAAHRST